MPSLASELILSVIPDWTWDSLLGKVCLVSGLFPAVISFSCLHDTPGNREHELGELALSDCVQIHGAFSWCDVGDVMQDSPAHCATRVYEKNDWLRVVVHRSTSLILALWQQRQEDLLKYERYVASSMSTKFFQASESYRVTLWLK